MLLRSLHFTGEEAPPFELKGSLFTLTVLHLFQLDRAAIERHLAEKIKQAPSFFNNTPVVIDLEGMTDSPEGLDFNGLYELLRAHGMVPVGIRNGTPMQQAAARLAGLPALPESRSANNGKKPERAEAALMRSRIVSHPIRSGQQIYAPEGDLIVLGAVSAGAEVIADGNIHVYGALRGRALAGVRGATETRIFCQSLEAELVSIAGRYRISEQIDPADRGKATQIHLMEDRLIIEHLSR
ncbi:MAG: septum site-determining protein MinC [Candidatus Competibacteraceae bacterium]|nr:septum site-determining protein MinC [Candidatus Competibacteraceae bacterium]MCB1821585.1 septum site-determining protein MinC [Candidatus Competibacteraceae bacterium]HRY15859.1 septum site-determining protein MinC [Candidatus Competibacteraceae bacterium]